MNAKEDLALVTSRIVKSPNKLLKHINDMHINVNNDKKQLKSIEKNSCELQSKLDLLLSVHNVHFILYIGNRKVNRYYEISRN